MQLRASSASVADAFCDADLVLTGQAVLQPYKMPPAVAIRKSATALGLGPPDRLAICGEPAVGHRTARHRADGDAITG